MHKYKKNVYKHWKQKYLIYNRRRKGDKDMKEKPLTIAYEELKQKIVKDINESNLPPLIIRPILENILNQIISAEKQQYELDKKQYEESNSTTEE
jgi:DNA-directed RNA polymerase subunit K/omega